MAYIQIPVPMRPYVDGHRLVHLDGSNAGEALQDLLIRYPALKPHLTREDGQLRAFANMFVRGENIRDLNGMDTPVGELEEIRLVLSIAGG